MTCYCISKQIVSPSHSLASNFFESAQQRSCHFLTITSSDKDNDNKPRLLIFFIHGVGSSSAIWIPYINNFMSTTKCPLKSQYNLHFVAPDLFGHGKSSSSRIKLDFTFAKLCDDLVALFDKEVASCKMAILIGHSYGCSISSFIAAERLAKIAGLCLISPPPPLPLHPKDPVLRLPTCCIYCLFPCFQMTFRREAYSSPICCPSAAERNAFNIEPHVFHNVMLGQLWSGGNEAFFASLSKCRCLVIHGANDRLVPVNEGEWTGRALGAKFVVIQTAGHMVVTEAVDEVNEQIVDFLNNLV